MSHKIGKNSLKGLLTLSLGALGVVYGDIGTSPLYSVNEIFFGHAQVAREASQVLGAISIVIWSLILIVAVKYIFFVLRADNEGEGGVFALYSLLRKIKKSKMILIVAALLVFGAGLLYGDGIITPAISVISAIEGLEFSFPGLKEFIVPITIVILTGLFLIQKKGTHKVGRVFGPIMIVWFACIGLIGAAQIAQQPGILAALNPMHAIQFLTTTEFHRVLLVMGSVMLVVTGGEAMYADMGHFGAKPIKISWIAIVFPALLLNYLGQGAFLLGGEAVKFNNVFYSAVPAWGIFPMVIISTLATIIASQALISGAFSLTSQAISLGFLPKIRIKHTNEGHEGQIYISAVNWLLYAGCVILVLVFRSSTNLAAAYGLAVSAIMLLTSTATILVSHYLWKWNWLKSILVFIPFLLIESLFFSANSLKLVQGGWIPLTIALVIYAVMQIWQWGRKYVEKTYKNLSTMKISELIKLKQANSKAFSNPSIFMTPSHIKSVDDKVPALLEVFWKRYNILPQDLILLNIHVSKEPFSHGQRYEILPLYNDKEKGHITFIRMNFGFMEEHNVEKILQTIMHDNAIPIPDCEGWLIHIISEKILFLKKSFIDKRVFSVYKMLANNSETADEYFGLGKDYELTIESVPVKII